MEESILVFLEAGNIKGTQITELSSTDAILTAVTSTTDDGNKFYYMYIVVELYIVKVSCQCVYSEQTKVFQHHKTHVY